MEDSPKYGVSYIATPPNNKPGRMTLDEYQQIAMSSAIYPNDRDICYLSLALCGEAGELADKVKKVIRDQHGQYYQPDIHALADELGDVMWYMANLANTLGYKLSDIARLNNEKINTRIKRGTLHGSGDNR